MSLSWSGSMIQMSLFSGMGVVTFCSSASDILGARRRFVRDRLRYGSTVVEEERVDREGEGRKRKRE